MAKRVCVLQTGKKRYSVTLFFKKRRVVNFVPTSRWIRIYKYYTDNKKTALLIVQQLCKMQLYKATLRKEGVNNASKN